jgi:beta-glucosidase
MPWSTDVAAILIAFMPGQMFGDALTNLLFGDVAPSAKLPLTMPNKDNEQGWQTRQWPGVNGKVYYDEGLFVGYKYYDEHKIDFTTGFPFGHGLSYSTFAYSSLAVKPAATDTALVKSDVDGGYGSGAAVATVSFTLANNGTRSAFDVPQMYLGFPASANEPPKLLRGFQKTMLMAGAKTVLSFDVAEQDVSIWDNTTHAWAKVAGKFGVYVGSSSRDIRLSGSMTV